MNPTDPGSAPAQKTGGMRTQAVTLLVALCALGGAGNIALAFAYNPHRPTRTACPAEGDPCWNDVFDGNGLAWRPR